MINDLLLLHFQNLTPFVIYVVILHSLSFAFENLCGYSHNARCVYIGHPVSSLVILTMKMYLKGEDQLYIIDFFIKIP